MKALEMVKYAKNVDADAALVVTPSILSQQIAESPALPHNSYKRRLSNGE